VLFIERTEGIDLVASNGAAHFVAIEVEGGIARRVRHIIREAKY